MPVGEKRGRFYIAGKPLKKIREKFADETLAADPYEIVSGRELPGQLSLPV
jgi:hypothetical protein